jgi:hypothetical protein
MYEGAVWGRYWRKCNLCMRVGVASDIGENSIVFSNVSLHRHPLYSQWGLILEKTSPISLSTSTLYFLNGGDIGENKFSPIFPPLPLIFLQYPHHPYCLFSQWRKILEKN